MVLASLKNKVEAAGEMLTFSEFLMVVSLSSPAICRRGMRVARGPSGIFSWLTSANTSCSCSA